FNHYADPDVPNMITPDGTRQFFEDLGLSIEDVLIFAIAWKMQTSTMGYISKEEWMNGMELLGYVSNILWSLLLNDKYPMVTEFIQFMEDKQPVKVVNRDQWYSFLEFISSDLASYDESSAWPVLFDEFVEWKRIQ
ncbi:hypothetical protein BDB01DRAFT_728997, partial [Pilobolus umbonatus]